LCYEPGRTKRVPKRWPCDDAAHIHALATEWLQD
jgi:hypothetical protein